MDLKPRTRQVEDAANVKFATAACVRLGLQPHVFRGPDPAPVTGGVPRLAVVPDRAPDIVPNPYP